MSVIGSCGCNLAESDGEHGLGFPVMYESEGCDAMSGFYRSVTYASVCAKCREKYREWGVLLETEAEADAWIDGDPKNEQSRQERA